MSQPNPIAERMDDMLEKVPVYLTVTEDLLIEEINHPEKRTSLFKEYASWYLDNLEI